MMAAPIASLPLFNWPEQLEIDAINQEREELIQAMDRLLPNSHRRIILQSQLLTLTARELQLEVKKGSS